MRRKYSPPAEKTDAIAEFFPNRVIRNELVSFLQEVSIKVDPLLSEQTVWME